MWLAHWSRRGEGGEGMGRSLNGLRGDGRHRRRGKGRWILRRLDACDLSRRRAGLDDKGVAGRSSGTEVLLLWGGWRRRGGGHAGERVKNLVLRQPDPEITLGGGEGVAKTNVRNSIHKRSELDGDVAGGNLLVQRAGRNAGGDPGGNHDWVETELLDAVAGQNRRKTEFRHAGSGTALRRHGRHRRRRLRHRGRGTLGFFHRCREGRTKRHAWRRGRWRWRGDTFL